NGYSAATEGSTVVSTRLSGTAFTTALRIDAAGSGTIASGPAKTTTVALTGPSNSADVWAITVDGTTYAHIVQAGQVPSDVAKALADLIDPSTGYTAAAEAATVAITKIDGTSF